jgi:hypothetical protein
MAEVLKGQFYNETVFSLWHSISLSFIYNPATTLSSTFSNSLCDILNLIPTAFPHYPHVMWKPFLQHARCSDWSIKCLPSNASHCRPYMNSVSFGVKRGILALIAKDKLLNPAPLFETQRKKRVCFHYDHSISVFTWKPSYFAALVFVS